MDIDGVNSIAVNGFGGARVDFDVACAQGFQNASGIVGGLDERSIAMDGAHTQQVDTRIVGGEEQCVRILITW